MSPEAQLQGWLLLFGLIVFIYYRYRRRLPSLSSTAHGTATLATEKDLKCAGMLSGKGLLIGRTLGKKSRLIYLPRYCHLSIFAPPGAGKSVSLAIPWALSWNRGSMIILDVKGEIYRASHEKQRAMGRKVVTLDPFNTLGEGGDQWNPLDLVGRDVNAIDECRAMAAAMVPTDKESKNRHFDDRARDMITAILVFIALKMKKEDRALGVLRANITVPGYFQACAETLMKMGGLFAFQGGAMLAPQGEERASVLSTVHRHTTFLDSPAILPCLQSGWDATEILDGNTTVYIILPPHQLEAQSRWLRLVVSSLFRLVGQHGMKNGKEVFALLDECGQVGELDPLIQGLTLLRAAGLRIAMFFQSLGQLKEVFGSKESIILDSTEQIFFGIQSYETAKRVSEMIGEYTACSTSFSSNEGESHSPGSFGHSGPSANYNSGSSTSVSSHKRSVLNPDEVLQLPGMAMVCFFKGIPPLIAKRLLYYSDGLFHPGIVWWARLKRLLLISFVAVIMAMLVNSINWKEVIHEEGRKPRVPGDAPTTITPKTPPAGSGRGGVLWQTPRRP